MRAIQRGPAILTMVAATRDFKAVHSILRKQFLDVPIADCWRVHCEKGTRGHVGIGRDHDNRLPKGAGIDSLETDDSKELRRACWSLPKPSRFGILRK